MVVADREFIGQKWLKWLKAQGIYFCVRVPKTHSITRIDGSRLSAEKLAELNPKGIYLDDCMVDGIWGNVFIKPLEANEILFLFGNVQTKLLGKLYRKRWTIEACFQNLKTRGFKLEDTHMKNNERLKS